MTCANGDVSAMGIESGSIHDQLISVLDLLDKVNPTVHDRIEVGILTVNASVKTFQINYRIQGEVNVGQVDGHCLHGNLFDGIGKIQVVHLQLVSRDQMDKVSAIPGRFHVNVVNDDVIQ
jgi:hypothetical protein